ncbi:MAG: 5,6-dimethylbenzimidazole synthase [Janthinobacterium lividum]
MTSPVFDAGFRQQLAALFRWRRDVRSFRPDPLPDGLVDSLLATGSGAPSVGLSQPWRYVLVDDPSRRAKVRASFAACNAAALSDQSADRAGLYARLKLEGMDQAPVHLAVCVEPAPAQGHGLGRMTQPETAAHSAVLAVHTIWLAARAEGVGLGWVSILEPDAVLLALDLPASWRLVAYLCLGYPAEESELPELERLGWEQRRTSAVLRR